MNCNGNVINLQESRPHLVPVMYARIYLLKGIQQVLHNALALLDIAPIKQMWKYNLVYINFKIKLFTIKGFIYFHDLFTSQLRQLLFTCVDNI